MSSGSTPTATATPPRSWTATAGWSPQLEVPSGQAGYEELLGLVAQGAPGRCCWALEGTGCYGAGLASFLAAHGEWVTEIDRPKRPRGRNGAKSDPLDAIRAGREALSREHLATPRQRGQREALRVLQVTRAGAVKVSADARRQLKALLAQRGVGPVTGAQVLISWSHPGRLRSEAAFAMLAGAAEWRN
jgi:Transposase